MDNINLDLLSNFKDNFIQESAQSYSNLKDTKLYIKLQDKKEDNKELLVIISFPEERFSHSSGLEHLPNIDKQVKESSRIRKKIRNKIFNDALNGKFDISKLPYKDKQALCSPITDSYCPRTKAEYTISDRIRLFADLEKNIELGFKNENIGKFYPWDKKLKFKIPNKDHLRDPKIEADYILILQSPYDPEEKINIFLACSGNTNNKNKYEINLEANSIFLDGIDFSHGLSKRYFTIEAEKVTPKEHSSLNNGSNPNTTEYMKMASNTIPSNITNQGGVGVIDINHQSLNRQFDFPLFGKIKQFFTEKIPQAFDIIKLKNEISELKEYISKREDQLDNALNEIEDNKLLLDEKDNLISEKDKQIKDLIAENTRLEKENAQLEEKVTQLSEKNKDLEQQKQPVTVTAAQIPRSRLEEPDENSGGSDDEDMNDDENMEM